MKFSQAVIDRVVARQGALHTCKNLDASKLAVVVVDMQNYFLRPVYQGAVAGAESVIPTINRLCGGVREKGGLIVWIRTSSLDADILHSIHHDEAFTLQRKHRRLQELHPTSDGFRLHPELDVLPDDVLVTKTTYSAMVQGSSDLPEILKCHRIETVLIAGTVTNVCCESTARDAMMQNYRTIMVDDSLAAITLEEHERSLETWITYFGDVLSTDETLERLS